MLGIAFGTRPEWLKIKSVVEELEKREIPFQLIFTGQHEDLVKDVGYPMRGINMVFDIDYDRKRLDNIVYSVLEQTNEWLGSITKLMVQGDTSSAFACALAAFHRQIPVIHLEAGLRTNDLTQPFPEEANRQMISCIASLHLCPTKDARENLIREHKAFQGITRVTGNTVLDNLRDVVVAPQKKVLVTMHRRENHELLWQWFAEIDELARIYSQYEFVLPIHPNPAVVQYKDSFNYVKVVDPMPHDELVDYLSQCSYVITDSGGIQEEAAFLKVPCAVCRRETERTEGLGNFALLCRVPENVSSTMAFLDNLKMEGPCPYGDGHAAEKVVDAIQGL
jgi:UDP-N-acetylglucosamine 2-epimerase (non-hydrolysing)